MATDIDDLLHRMEPGIHRFEATMDVANAAVLQRAEKVMGASSLDALRRNLTRFSGARPLREVPDLERLTAIHNAAVAGLEQVSKDMAADLEAYDHVGAATDLVNDFVSDAVSAGVSVLAMADQLITAGAALLVMAEGREAAVATLTDISRGVAGGATED